MVSFSFVYSIRIEWKEILCDKFISYFTSRMYISVLVSSIKTSLVRYCFLARLVLVFVFVRGECTYNKMLFERKTRLNTLIIKKHLRQQ